MPRTTTASRLTALEHDVADLKSGIADILAAVSAPAPAKSAPKRGRAKSKVRTFATKAEREAGKGFACKRCGRDNLRVAPHEGSFHKTPDGESTCEW